MPEEKTKIRVNYIVNILFILGFIVLIDTYGLIAGGLFLCFLTAWFTYRIWFNKNDLMYQAREQLETVMFGKPFYHYKKGEKIKMKKFGGIK